MEEIDTEVGNVIYTALKMTAAHVIYSCTRIVCTDVNVTQEEAKKWFIIQNKHGLLTIQLRLL